MSTKSRPVHSTFETMRLAGLSARTSHGYHRFSSVASEQLSGRDTATRRGGNVSPMTVLAGFSHR